MIFQKKIIKTKGTAIVEILLAVGIIVTLSIAAVSYYSSQQRIKTLENATVLIVNHLRYSQQKAITQEENSSWGVRFENPAGSGNDFYGLFKGTSYTPPPRERMKLTESLEFTDPADNSGKNIVFEALTGKLSSPTSISVTVRIIGTNIVAIITVNPQGTISVEK